MEVYEIPVCDHLPPVRFLYINGYHSTDKWIRTVDLNCCKINFFVRGISTIVINGTPHRSSAGDILLYRPHEQHYGCIPYPQTIEYFELLFEPETLYALCGGKDFIKLFETKPEDGLPHTLLRLPEDALISLRKRFYGLLEMVRSAECRENLPAVLEYLGLLRRIAAFRNTAYAIDDPEVYPAVLTAILNYIDRNFREKADNQSICAACGISRTYLNRLFRKYLHCTPHEYIQSCRLAQAKSLLDSGRSVTDACYLSGFRDCSAFGKVFRKAVGLTPSAYKKQT